MAAEPKKEEKKKTSTSAINRVGQAGMVADNQGEEKLQIAPPRQYKDSLRNVGDDIPVEEVQESAGP